MKNPWFTLEAVPGLVTSESDWHEMVGPAFASFNALCLQPSALQIQRVRCPRQCGCDHLVIARHDGNGGVGVCRCNPSSCPDLALTRPDITALELSESRLGHALCLAFGLHPRQSRLPVPNTFQFGSWSSEEVPAILTIQVQNAAFRRAVAELAVLLRQRFMLFAPTSDFLDAPALGILENYGASFFALETHVVLTEYGTLQPTGVPGELFAKFTPQPKEMDTDLATRVFGLVQKLDTDQPLKPPTLLTVFRRYCIEELSCDQVARKCHTTKTTVVRRLAMIRARVGVHPRQLRRVSPHLAKLEDSFSNPNAPHLHRPALIDDSGGLS